MRSLRYARLALVIVVTVASTPACRRTEDSTQQSRKGRATFTKDIAPIIFQNCASCHRPGQSAPFSLLTFQEVKKHAADIARVTARRYMPPWLPEEGYGDFLGERRLTTNQIAVIRQWVEQGTTEGEAADLPPLPK